MSIRFWHVRGSAATLVALAVLVSCSAQDASKTAKKVDEPGASVATPESASAKARISELRARFILDRAEPMARAPQDALAKMPRRMPALGAAVATAFERSEAGALRAVLPAAAKRGVARPASVDLPMHADGESRLEDGASHVSVRFRLQGATPSAVTVADGYALYPGALEGADVVHRVHVEGTEDYVVFERRPAREELRYDVDVSRVPGLRLVSNTLEFLDESGSPALRVAPPYVVDAVGARHDARLAVSGCEVDTNAAAPWGRRVTRPGAARCTIQISWSGVIYPAMVDPAWGATGTMAAPRKNHTASVLPSGKVLIAGGVGNTLYLATAELFDPSAGGGAGAFAATGSMRKPRAFQTASVLPSGKVLVAGGYYYDSLSAVYVYDASAEIFDAAGGGGGGTFAATGSMTAGRQNHTATVLPSGKVLVTGGTDGTVVLQSAELFDAAAAGGAGAFAPTGSMVSARGTHTASLLSSGKVLLAGGYFGGRLATAELFDPAANGGAGAFAPTGSLASGRSDHTASVLPSGKVLVVGGIGSTNLIIASAELFDPAANGGAGAFAATGSMATAREYHTASPLPSGKVLIAGSGNVSSGPATLAVELFDPTANGGAGAFAATSSMATQRWSHTASVLPSGKVVVTGGFNAVSVLASAELFGGVQGEACTSGYCLSGFCADGFCCDTACATGGCDRCDLAGTEGTCTLAPTANPGANPVCAFPFVCDGANAACPTTCTSDSACAAAYYCAPNGTCLARKAQAAACNTLLDCAIAGCRECASDNCVDGVCCDNACGGTCQACTATLKQSGAATGTCGPIKDGIDPRSECAPTGVLCGPDGTCNGAGACRLFTPSGISCGTGVCQGTVARGELCDGAGTCGANAAGVECSPFLCANGGCTSTCVTSADCAPDGWCSAGKCEKRTGDGKACTLNEQCTHNVCADGVCCNAPCKGQCEACDVLGAEGTCFPVSDHPHNKRPACAPGTADKPCSATQCDGISPTTCAGFVGSSVSCGTASCTEGTALAAGKCDGQGTCKAPAPRHCNAFACGVTACNETCAKDADCADGNTCDLPTSKCVSRATCDGEHTTIAANGTPHDCTPYRCGSSGTCLQPCTSVGDCVSPALCDTNHECVLPPAVDSGSSSGCAVARARAPGGLPQLAWLAAGITVLAARRRKRAQSRKGEER